MECTKSVHPREGIRFREAVSECGELIRLNDANRVHLSWSGLPSQRPESRLIRLLDVRPASSTLGDKIALSQHVSDQDRSDEVEGRGPDEGTGWHETWSPAVCRTTPCGEPSRN